MYEGVSLEAVIREVREKADSYASLYQSNEEATKQHLILPILSALGWDIFSPEVLPEERVRGPSGYYRVDYSLQTRDKVVAYIEAKSLGVNVFADRGALHQLVHYCAVKGVDIGILTNGIQWVVIKAYESGKSLDERIILKIDIKSMDTHSVIEKLRYLTKENIEKEIPKDTQPTERNTTNKNLHNDDIKISSLMKNPDPPNGAKFLNELTPEELTGRPKLLEVYIYNKGTWHHVPVERNAWAMSLFAVVKFLWEQGFENLYVPTYVEKTYVRSPGATDVIGPWHVYRPENGRVAVSKLRELEKKTGVKIAVKVLKRY